MCNQERYAKEESDPRIRMGLAQGSTFGLQRGEGPMESTRPRFNLDDIFKYHEAGPEDLVAYRTIRAAAKHFAQVVLDCTPPCADQTDAIRKVREAVMTANAAVALRGTI